MKIYTVSILLTVLLVNEISSQEFTFAIKVTDGTFSKYVYLGIHPDGTSGFDPGLDTLAPPPPPSGSFDTRLEYLNEDYYTDIRDNTLNQKEYYLQYSPSTGGSIIIFWDSSLVKQYGEFIIKDNITGGLFSLDMSTADSLDINQYPVLQNGLKILVTPFNTSNFEYNNDHSGIDNLFYLDQNYPNPFNPSTTIKFALAKESYVNLSIYNVLGELVTTLINEQFKAGYYEYELNGGNFASGVYLYRLQAEAFIETKKMLLLR